jgi:hypothetical protein
LICLSPPSSLPLLRELVALQAWLPFHTGAGDNRTNNVVQIPPSYGGCEVIHFLKSSPRIVCFTKELFNVLLHVPELYFSTSQNSSLTSV